jgi:DNA-binding FadR family transcriptional regulator
MFRKTTQNRIYHDLVEQIQDAILAGKLKPGDKLPAQRKLVEEFQTSRASLREALRVLEHKGLIEIKLGVHGGAVVKEINTEQITEDLSLLMRHQKVSYSQLAEFREGVEGCAAALAAERASKKDIKRLKKLLAKARKHLEVWDSEWTDFFHVDLEIHIVLAEISRNPVYIVVLRMVHENILEQLFFKDEQGLTENYQALCDIVGAIESGDGDRARSLVQNHIVQCTRAMMKAHPDLNTSQ